MRSDVDGDMTSLSTLEPRPKKLEQEQEQEKEQQATDPLTTFVLFRKLPPELRLRIWSLILSGPRTVSIKEVGRRPRRRTKKEIAGLPAILMTCNESRTVALKHHTVISSQGGILPSFYDAKHDVVRMLGQAAFYEFGGGTWIKHLVLVMNEREVYWAFTISHLKCLTELKSLVIEIRGAGPLEIESEKIRFAVVWITSAGRVKWPTDTFLLHDGKKTRVPDRRFM